MVRLWPEEASDEHAEWCGNVQHVSSGEARTFRDWPGLAQALLDLLPDQPAGQYRAGDLSTKHDDPQIK